MLHLVLTNILIEWWDLEFWNDHHQGLRIQYLGYDTDAGALW